MIRPAKTCPAGTAGGGSGGGGGGSGAGPTAVSCDCVGGSTGAMAMRGLAHFDCLSIGKAGRYFLRFSAMRGSAIIWVHSDAFNVLPGTWAGLRILTPLPNVTVAGQPVAPRVELQPVDACGNMIPRLDDETVTARVEVDLPAAARAAAGGANYSGLFISAASTLCNGTAWLDFVTLTHGWVAYCGTAPGCPTAQTPLTLRFLVGAWPALPVQLQLVNAPGVAGVTLDPVPVTYLRGSPLPVRVTAFDRFGNPAVLDYGVQYLATAVILRDYNPDAAAGDCSLPCDDGTAVLEDGLCMRFFSALAPPGAASGINGPPPPRPTPPRAFFCLCERKREKERRERFYAESERAERDRGKDGGTDGGGVGEGERGRESGTRFGRPLPMTDGAQPAGACSIG